MKELIIVEVRGGMVQAVYSNSEANILIVDRDNTIEPYGETIQPLESLPDDMKHIPKNAYWMETYQGWLLAFGKLLKKRTGLDVSDIDDWHSYAASMTPKEAVDRLMEKYDLVELRYPNERTP